MAAQAVKIGDTLFRVDEISWVKVRRLTTWEQIARALLVMSGIAFLALVGYAKGTFWNIEGLLGFLPISFGAAIRGHYRVASSGDTEDSYMERSAQGLARPVDLAEAMSQKGLGVLEYKSPRSDYYYVIRPERIAWIRPWFDLNLQPLILTLVFGLYWLIAPRHWPIGDVQILKDLKLLQWGEPGAWPAMLATALVLLGSILAIAASYKKGVELAAVGGVRETLHMYHEDRGRIFGEISGRGSDVTAPAAPPPPVEAPTATAPG